MKYSPGKTGYHVSSHSEDIDYIRRNIPCQWACPAQTDVPGYIDAIFQSDFNLAYMINRNANLFPGVLGRICSRPCESACRHGEPDLGEAVAICHLKRVAADFKTGDHLISEQMFTQTGKSVAIAGAGPAGLAAAHSLAIFGHQVTVYDAMPKLGGMLLYGIPEFRLPREVLDQEIYNVTRLGIQMKRGVRLGTDLSLDELRRQHSAVVIATGCYDANHLQIPGENLNNVYSGLTFLMQVNAGSAPPVGKRALIIGGGFTAMDCARTCRRLGVEHVTICILNVEEDLTVTRDEVLETKREGIRFLSLVSAMEILGEKTVEAVRFKRNRFGGTRGQSGRTVIPIHGSEFTVSADMVIAAIGQRPESTVFSRQNAPLKFDRESGIASIPGVFLAGDCARGASTVIEAIGHGKKVAVNVDSFLMGRTRRRKSVLIETADDTQRKREWDFIGKHHIPSVDVQDRFHPPETEVETGFTPETGLEEAKRCYLCHLKYEIHIPECIYCRWCIDVCPRDCIELALDLDTHPKTDRSRVLKTHRWNETAAIIIDNDRCIRCGECYRICPTQCIHVTRVSLTDQPLSRGAEETGEPA